MPGTKLDRVGIFRARPVEWSLQDSPKDDSKAKNVNVRFEIISQGGNMIDGEREWSPLWPSGVEVYGRFYVIGKAGNFIHETIERVMDSIGWSGKFQDIGRTPQEVGLLDCRIEVEENVWNGKTNLQVEWLNPYDWEGAQGMSGLDNADLLALDSERGAEMRAIVGKIQQEKADDPTATAPGQPVEAAPPASAAPPPPPASSGEP